MRAAFTRVELVDGGVTVVNFFGTIRLPPGSVRVAGFAPPRWDGFPVPLVLVGDGLALRATGISIRSRQVRWPDLIAKEFGGIAAVGDRWVIRVDTESAARQIADQLGGKLD